MTLKLKSAGISLAACLLLAFTTFACGLIPQPISSTRDQASPVIVQATTTTAAPGIAAREPAEVIESTEELPGPGLFGADWIDRSVYESGLLPSQRGILDGLPGASIYHVDLEIQENLARVSGVEQVLYTNRARVPFTEVYFRLYPNLISGASMSIQAASVDGEVVEPILDLGDSLMRLPLPEDLQPGEQTVLELHFEIDLPPIDQTPYGMFGLGDDSLALPYGYPTLAVFGDEGWNVEIPPAWGEISFTETSFYQVRVSAPRSLTLISSGVELGGHQAGDLQVRTYAAGPMRDFYLYGGRGLQPTSRDLGGTTINSYAPPELQEGANLALDLAAESLESFNERLEPFPYSEFDIVSTSTSAGGIEYPGVIVINQGYYDLSDPSAGFPVRETLERTVAHEVAHQWFYGLVGNDSVDEPWLDEAFAQYMTGQYYLDAHGQAAREIYTQDWSTRWNRVNQAAIPIGLPSDQYPGPAYSAIIYGRGPLFLQALAMQMGGQKFDTFLKDYVQAHTYGVVTGEQFKREAESSCKCNLTSLFDTWVYGGAGTGVVGQDQPTPTTDGGKTFVLDAGVTFEAAQDATDFTLRMPGYFPDGYEFKGANLSSSQEATLNYVRTNPARLAVLVQTVVGAQSQVELVMDETETQDVTIGGREANWSYDEAGDEAVLEWTANGVRYLLIGITDLAQATEIAESIR